MSNKNDDFYTSYPHALNANTKSRDTTLLSTGISKLQFLFDIERFSTKVIIVFFVSIFIGIYNFFILERTGLYSLGINAVFQSIARCVRYFLTTNSRDVGAKVAHIILFWMMSLLMNVPLAIFGFRKIGRNFAILTVINICVSSCTSILLSSLPEDWGLKSFYMFSDPRTFDKGIIDKGINILQWNHFTTLSTDTVSTGQAAANIVMNDSSRVVLIFLYGIFLGLLNTVSSVFIYSLGGSTGGMDWILYYFVKRKRKRIQTMYFYLSVLIAFIAYLVGTYVPYAHHMFSSSGGGSSSSGTGTNNGVSSLNNTYHSVISSLLGPMFIATVLAALVKRILFHLFYPNFKIISVKIFTNKVVEIRRQLLKCNFPQAFTINAAIGGYMLRDQAVFEVTCFVLDLKMLKELTRKVDPSCLIIVTPTQSIMGRLVVRDNIS